MGLFSKKESQYELPAKLEMLLKMAVEDGEVTEKELSVLLAEAQKHDISEAELEMIIQSRLHSAINASTKKPTVSSEKVKEIIQNIMDSEYTENKAYKIIHQLKNR